MCVAATESHRFYDGGKGGGCSVVSLREAAFPPALRRGLSWGDALPGSCSVMHIWECSNGGPRGLACRYRIAVEE